MMMMMTGAGLRKIKQRAGSFGSFSRGAKFYIRPAMQPLQSCPFPSLCLALPANLRQHIRPSISQHAQHTTRFRDSTITALSPSSPAFDIHVPSVSTRLLHPSVPSVGLPVILSSQAELPVVRNEISG